MLSHNEMLELLTGGLLSAYMLFNTCLHMQDTLTTPGQEAWQQQQQQQQHWLLQLLLPQNCCRPTQKWLNSNKPMWARSNCNWHHIYAQPMVYALSTRSCASCRTQRSEWLASLQYLDLAAAGHNPAACVSCCLTCTTIAACSNVGC